MTTIVDNNNGENPEKAIDDELALIENPFEYLTKKKCPQDAARIIKESFEEKQRDLKNELEKYSTRNEEGVW